MSFFYGDGGILLNPVRGTTGISRLKGDWKVKGV